jgi:hypothetical protein
MNDSRSTNINLFNYKDLRCSIGQVTHPYLDHVEIYETLDDKIVFLASPYTDKDESYKEFIKEMGFTDTKPLYNAMAATFYKVYKDFTLVKQEVKERLTEIKKLANSLDGLITPLEHTN